MAKKHKYEENIEKLQNNISDVLNIEEIKGILQKYNFLKKSINNLHRLKSDFIKNCSIEELREARPVLNETASLKERVKKMRTDFISYTVISPYLANTERLICLSTAKELIGHNEEYLREAVKTMARGVYKDLLLQSHQDVREQFVDVSHKLKQIAGDKELEDLKVIQTLADTASKAKKTGADLWWE